MTTFPGPAGREIHRTTGRPYLGRLGLNFSSSSSRPRGSFQERDPCDLLHPGPTALPSLVGDAARGWGGDPHRPSHTREGQGAAPAVHLGRLGEGTRWCGRLDTARETLRILRGLPPLRGPPAHRDAGRSRGEAGEGTSSAGSAQRARRGLGSRHPPAQAGAPAARGRRGRRHRRDRGRHRGRRGRRGRGRRGAGRREEAAAGFAATGGRGRLRLRLQRHGERPIHRLARRAGTAGSRAR